MSHALRHEPWVYELELDDEGWTPVDVLLQALRRERAAWGDLEASDLVKVIESSSKRRHEIEGESIRALYGHSVVGKLRKSSATPPELLYHGTSPNAVIGIKEEGLKPMGRQYVHLSVDEKTAHEVGRRKCAAPVILIVDADDADRGGITFYQGNEMVWLADEVPSTFIRTQ